MLRAWAAAALICWQLAGAAPLSAQEFRPSGPYTHPASRLTFPETLGGMQRAFAYDYEPQHPGLGVSVKYASRAPTIVADVYVFNLGQARIADGIVDPLVNRMFQDAIRDIYGAEKAGRYRNVNLIGTDSVALNRQPGAPRMLRARLSYVLGDADVYSHVYGMAVNDHFVKARFTYRQDQDAQAQEVLTAFLQELGTVVGQLQ